jgi:hypothetical protein
MVLLFADAQTGGVGCSLRSFWLLVGTVSHVSSLTKFHGHLEILSGLTHVRG